MSRVKVMLVCVLLFASAGIASAQDAPKWSYIEAGFLDFDPDAGPSDDGTFAGISFGLFSNFHILAEYDDIGDYTFWNAGLGWHGLLGDPGDIFAEAVWTDVSLDTPTGDVDDDGYEVSGGIRWQLGKWFDLKGQVNWVDLDVGGSDTTYEVEGLVTFLDQRLGIGASYEVGDADTMRAFGRFAWGN